MTLSEAIAVMPWRWALLGGGMPPHHYFVVERPDPAADLLLAAIKDQPEAYDAYFRGYQRQMRYLEIGEWRYWPTAPGGTLMLNRCTLDSVEPPRHVDQGAKPMPWEGPPWAEYGSPWPPGYVEDPPGRWVYHRELDPRRGFDCPKCGKRYWLSAYERPCPNCGNVPEVQT